MKKEIRNAFLGFLFAATVALAVASTSSTGVASEASASDVIGSSYVIYAEFPGIDGEATDKDHLGWVEITSFSFGMSKPSGGTGPTRRRGDVVLDDIVLTKWVDLATTPLMEACASGHVLGEVTVDFVKNVGDRRAVFYKYVLSGCLVTSYSSYGGALDGVYPTDTLSLSYEEITVTYLLMDVDGDPLGTNEWSYSVEARR